MADLKVIIKSGDKEIQRICSEYWAGKSEGSKYTWVTKVSNLCENRGLTLPKYIEIIAKNSYSHFVNAKECEQCGDIYPLFRKRSEVSTFAHYADPRVTTKDLCYTCFNIAYKAYDLELLLNKSNDRTRYIETIVMSYESEVYDSLNNLEFRYLIELAKSKDPSIANQVVGISSSDALKIIDKLIHKHLINNRYYELPLIPDQIAEKLSSLTLPQKVKPVFGSDREKDIYKMLRGQMLPVFPQMAVCSFIPKENVQHLFLKEWHKEYYKSCRVDLIVMEHQTFIPQYVIEYQGGSHEDGISIQKDEFKRMIIQEAGLNIIYIDNKKLAQLKSKGDFVNFPEDFI